MTSQAAIADAKRMNKKSPVAVPQWKIRKGFSHVLFLMTLCMILSHWKSQGMSLITKASASVLSRIQQSKCPLTNTDYGVKLHYADCISIRKLLTMYLGDGAYQRFDDSNFRKEYEAISVDRPVEPDTFTLFTLGRRYRYADGVEQDFLWAKLFFELAAGRGHAKAQFNLGFLHGKGHGVEQDYEKAKYYYEQAAEQGSVDAQQYNLGIIYSECDIENGVEQDYE